MLKSVVAVAATVLASSTLGVGTASASDSPSGGIPEQTAGIRWFGRTVQVDRHHPDQAVVVARYSCTGVGIHLWASVKQGKGVNAYQGTTERPSPPSDVARAWYETGDEAVPFCDGRAHTLRYTLDRATTGTETHPAAWKRLKNGRAWAQFVVFSVPAGTDPGNPDVVPDREAFAGWVHVQLRHCHGGHHH